VFPAIVIMRSISPILLLLGALLLPITATAQDDTDAQPLGDLARTLRQKKLEQPPPGPADTVIDNDNLAQVMEDAKNARPIKPDKTVFSIDPATNTLKVSSPDVTCSLSFNSKSSALLIKPVLLEDLPLNELIKIDGPGSIQDESLQLQVFNGTDWDIREITVGLTLERKPGENAEQAARARIIPASESSAAVTVERRSDVTLLFHLKAQAKPFTTQSFHEAIGITPGPDEDWRWSIVEAKGIRPAQAPTPGASSESPTESISDPLFASPRSVLPGLNESQKTPPIPLAPDKSSSPAPEQH
jgi:hypothetical protein